MNPATTRGATRSNTPRAQSGLALIVAMLVAALAATVAISLASAQAQWSAQVMQRRDRIQAESIALAGVQWARQILDADDRATTIDHLGEPWALPLPATPVENGFVEGRIVDAQGFLNVNDLAEGSRQLATRQRFERLFDMQQLPRGVIPALVDWVDADDVAEAGGAEDGWYRTATQPTLTPNMPLLRPQELAAVRGMTPGVIERLSRFVMTLPRNTPLNVNTAPPEVLAATIANIEPAALAGLIASRNTQPFASISDFRERVPIGAALGEEASYTVKSKFFLVLVRARQGDTFAQAHALIERGGNWPRIVWQTLE